MVEISLALRARISKISEASRAVCRATRAANAELYASNIRFPDSIDIVMRHLELDLDHLSLLLAREDSSRWISEQGAADHNPSEDGRKEAHG